MEKGETIDWHFGLKLVVVRDPGRQVKAEAVPMRRDVLVLWVESCSSKRYTEALSGSYHLEIGYLQTKSS